MASVEIKGLDKLLKKIGKLDRVGQHGANDIIKKHTRSEAERLRKRKYPPKLPNQKYVRTGRLGRSFTPFQRGASVFGVRNDTPYGVWVIWRGAQVSIHAGRWWTFQREVENNVRKLRAALDKCLKKQGK